MKLGKDRLPVHRLVSFHSLSTARTQFWVSRQAGPRYSPATKDQEIPGNLPASWGTNCLLRSRSGRPGNRLRVKRSAGALALQAHGHFPGPLVGAMTWEERAHIFYWLPDQKTLFFKVWSSGSSCPPAKVSPATRSAD